MRGIAFPLSVGEGQGECRFVAPCLPRYVALVSSQRACLGTAPNPNYFPDLALAERRQYFVDEQLDVVGLGKVRKHELEQIEAHLG